AALMLQYQFLRLPAGDVAESLIFLGRLGLLIPGRPAPVLREGVLTEGYTTTEPIAFLREFRHHLGRMNRVLSPLGRTRVSPRALRDFLVTTHEECKLALARYLFSPREVAERIFAQVRQSAGEAVSFHVADTRDEARRQVALLPDFEASIVRALCECQASFWA